MSPERPAALGAALAQEMPVAGLSFTPRAMVPAKGGPVLHLLRGQALNEVAQGEIYFSEVLPGCIKAWKRHRRQTQNFAVPSGRLLLAVYDDRQDSPSRGICVSLELGRPDAWGLLRIPPMLWYGFAALGREPALICNCADLPHDPDEAERLPLDAPGLPDCLTTILAGK